MQIGFNSAILADLDLDGVLALAAQEGFAVVELMCWPPGKAERRYAGVAHLDVDAVAKGDVNETRDLLAIHGVSLSALGYYPNPLAADRGESELAVAHLNKLIDAAAHLGVGTVTTFVGRDPSLSVDANWPRFLDTWQPILLHAIDKNIRIGIENCPMRFGADEWPGGKNLATSPALWRRMFADLPSPNFGLNYDPSHFILQMMDPAAPLAEFADRIFHVHAKDARIDRRKLDEVGVFDHPKLWHTPKLPGQGDVDWGALIGALADTGYDGAVAIEVEDRAFEGSMAKRRESLVVSRRYLLQYLPE